MQFITRKRRPAPAVIIVSLIDILMVLLIFLMINTSFTKLPSLKLTLPESKQAVKGATEAKMVVTVWTNEPYFYIADQPVTIEELKAQLETKVREEPDLKLAIMPDTEAAIGKVYKVADIARDAGVRTNAVSILFKPAEE